MDCEGCTATAGGGVILGLEGGDGCGRAGGLGYFLGIHFGEGMGFEKGEEEWEGDDVLPIVSTMPVNIVVCWIEIVCGCMMCGLETFETGIEGQLL